jgi:heat shock protein HslJ
MKKLLAILTVVCLTLTSTSCKETKDVITTASNLLLNGSYTVSTINGEQITLQTLTIDFSSINEIVNGNAGCNEYSGSYSVDTFALSIGILTATQAYCDEPLMKLERSYMKALKNIGSYAIKGEKLILYSKTDRSLMITAKRNN